MLPFGVVGVPAWFRPSLNTDIGVEFSSFQKALTKLQHLDPNHKLRKAFQADAACQAL